MKFRLCLPILIVAFAGLPGGLLAGPPAALFQHLEESTVEALLTPEEKEIEDLWTRSIRRRSYVSFDPAPLDAAGPDGKVTVELNLFPDVIFDSTLETDHSVARKAWIGSLDGVPLSRAVFVRSTLPQASRTEAPYASTIRAFPTTYRLRKAGTQPQLAGVYAVEEVAFEALPPTDFVAAGSVSRRFQETAMARDLLRLEETRREAGSLPGGMADLGLLFLYSPGAGAQAAGGVESLIFMIELEINQIFANSEITARVEVLRIAEYPFQTTGSPELDRDLLKSDPLAMSLRDGAAADLVHLLVDDSWSQATGLCGIADLNGSLHPEMAYSISAEGCLEDFTPAHELAHTMGCNHPLEQPTGIGAFHFCHGFTNIFSAYQTVMSNGTTCQGCITVPYFSDNALTFAGQPLGSEEEDNSRCLRLTTPFVESFRNFVVEYDLQVFRDGTGTGTVGSVNIGGIDCGNDCMEVYPGGEQVQLEATPDAGSTFAGWDGDGACFGTDNPVTIHMVSPIGCTATFDNAGDDPVLTVHKPGTGAGTVDSNPAGIDCGPGCQQESATFPEGTPVTLTATEAADSEFVGWGGDCSGSQSTATVTLDRSRSCTATFEATGNASLTVTKIGGGTGSVTSTPAGISCAPACQQDSAAFPSSTFVRLSESAAAGSFFSGWGGDCSATGTVTMNGPKSCTASFEQGPSHTLTISLVEGDGAQGDVSSSPAGILCEPHCTGDFGAGNRVDLTAVASEGLFRRWGGDCSGTDPSFPLVMDSDKACVAVFSCLNPIDCNQLP